LAAIRRQRAVIVGEIRSSRRVGGLSLKDAAGAVGMHPSTFGRIERNELNAISLEELGLATAAVGLELSIKTYPRGDPARDAAHLRLLARFRARMSPSLPWRTEVPLPLPGDLRALDGASWIGGDMLAVEAETKLHDLQALERRVLLKQRDSRAHCLVLLVADSVHNRATLAVHREALRGSFPLDTREVLGALGRGEMPQMNGIVVL
jgi:transcriptional regulator with XRE-family HTH domain